MRGGQRIVRPTFLLTLLSLFFTARKSELLFLAAFHRRKQGSDSDIDGSVVLAFIDF